MSNVIRMEAESLRKKAIRLATETLRLPKSEREYMLACGKFQQMEEQAKLLEDRYLKVDEDPHADPEPERTSRVDQARRRHIPRQY